MIGVLCTCMVLEWFSKNSHFSFDTLSWFGKYSLELYIMHIMLHRILSPHMGGYFRVK